MERFIKCNEAGHQNEQHLIAIYGHRAVGNRSTYRSGSKRRICQRYCCQFLVLAITCMIVMNCIHLKLNEKYTLLIKWFSLLDML